MERPNKKRVARLLRGAAKLCAENGEQGIYDGACCFIGDVYWETVWGSRSGEYRYADYLNAMAAFDQYIKPRSRRNYWFGPPNKQNVNVRVLALCLAAAIVETEGV